jgi:hypothetical protein
MGNEEFEVRDVGKRNKISDVVKLEKVSRVDVLHQM